MTGTLKPQQKFTATVAPAMAVGGMPDPTSTLGDLIVRGPGADVERLGVGADGSVLYADSTQPLGMKWLSASALQTPWQSDIDAAGHWLHNWGGGVVPVGGAIQFSLASGSGALEVADGYTYSYQYFAVFNALRVFNNPVSLVVESTGVGINQATPAYPLDVIGDINTNGVYRVKGAARGSLGTGRVGSDGTMYNNSAWTCDHSATGTYIITHNLNVDPTTYVVLVCPSIDPPAELAAPKGESDFISVSQQTADSFTISVLDGSSLNPSDAAFNFGVFQ